MQDPLVRETKFYIISTIIAPPMSLYINLLIQSFAGYLSMEIGNRKILGL